MLMQACEKAGAQASCPPPAPGVKPERLPDIFTPPAPTGAQYPHLELYIGNGVPSYSRDKNHACSHWPPAGVTEGPGCVN